MLGLSSSTFAGDNTTNIFLPNLDFLLGNILYNCLDKVFLPLSYSLKLKFCLWQNKI